jgi:biopolymer transport protein ExbD
MLTSPVITPEALDLILPKAKGKTTNKQNVSVSITKDLKYFVDGEQVPLKNLESALKSKLSGVDQPTVILRAEKDVILQKAVDVMSIANDNKYKLVLAVKPN